jgi:uncharacterized protein involved in exopolysaccharide biosynthesis
MADNAAEKTVRVSVRDIFFILFYKLHVFVLTFVIIAGLVIAYAWTATPTYEAFGSVLLRPLHDSRELLHNEQGRFSVVPVTPEDLNSEVEIMMSDALLRKVVNIIISQGKVGFQNEEGWLSNLLSSFEGQGEGPGEKALKRLRNKLEVTPVTKSNIIEVKFRDSDAEVSAAFINTLFDLYVDRHIELRKSGDDVGFYEEQIRVATESLTEAEDALLAFQEEWSIIQIHGQREQNVMLMRLLRENLSLVRSNVAGYKRKKSLVENKLKNGEPLPMTEEFRNHDAFVELLRNLTPLLVERERIAILYPEDSVEYQDTEGQLKRVQNILDREQEKLIEGIEVDLQALLEKQDVLERELRDVNEESILLTQKEVELERLKRDVAISNRNFALYFDKREEARIEAVRDNARLANVSIMSWANVPLSPAFPKKGLMVIVAVISGFIVGIACTFATYAMDHSIKRPEDISVEFDMPVFSSLETVRTRKSRGL